MNINFGDILNVPVFAHFWVIPLFLWSLVWKGLALWHSARHGHRNWFIALLVINTAGILEILYLYYFSKKHKAQS